ncbi:cation-transporting P-type ATPase [Aurantimonas sp. A2-1-M11]|uniref:cation-translocating P-type ATPase n=1 Tax=Aurantimonas sp. A2-1-M11 TaxID=3113712 RepID=UPI002F9348C7
MNDRPVDRRDQAPSSTRAEESTEAAFSRTVEDVVESLRVDPGQGLSDEEVARRREKHGENRLRRAVRKSVWAVLVDQFKSLIFALLGAAAALSFFLGEFIQGTAILIAVLINAAIGFFTELRAMRSMEALRELERDTARVRRDGKEREVESAELVPGDLVLLEAGEVVPADLRLMETSNLQVNESALTGESVPVGKTTEAIEGDPQLADRENMAFKGTSIAIGSGIGGVTGTGMNTELGSISQMAEEAEEARSPLEQRLDKLSQRLLVVILVIAAVTALIGVVRGRDLMLMIETGVALVVAAVPEGLPIVASVALARGMWRLARRNALIERLTAVETLGAVTVICSDKTGTLTENRMALSRIRIAAGEVSIGEGENSFALDDEHIDPGDHAALKAALEVSVLCNSAVLDEGDDEERRGTGDPMEVALLEGGRHAGLDREELVGRMEEVRREEFDPDVKMMATYHRVDEGVLIAVKGAPEAVLEVCARVLGDDDEPEDLDEEARNRWQGLNDELAGKGLRALALAQKRVPDESAGPYEDLTLIGLVGLLDPPRSEVRDAVLECRRAGIRVAMVTGDQPNTARAIAAAVGLVDDSDDVRVVEGKDMPSAENKLTEEEQSHLLNTPIFARFNPAQKLDLIQIYQDAGFVVAMTGDGVNDAPALKKADIGVAMGQRGTEVARDAADMVLLDDSFATIVAAVKQGRTIFGNIRRFVVYMLSGNTGEIFAVSLMALLNAPLPLLPLQILYINIVSDVFPALALGVGETAGDVMKRPPRDPKEPILTRRIWGVIGGYGVLIGASVLIVFWLAFEFGMSRYEAVTVSFLTFGFARLWHVFNMRDADSPVFRNEITTNRYVWIAIGIGIALMLGAIYLPVLGPVLNTVPPDLQGWTLIVCGSLAPLVIGQLLKLPGPQSLFSRLFSR